MIYIAGPFFNEEQKEAIERIENALANNLFSFYSPMRDGIIGEMEKPDFDVIYKNNVDNIAACSSIVAVIDDRDMGTIFEIGYGAALGKDIITLTSKNYGLNVMIERAVRFHAKSLDQMIFALLNPEKSLRAFITS